MLKLLTISATLAVCIGIGLLPPPPPLPQLPRLPNLPPLPKISQHPTQNSHFAQHVTIPPLKLPNATLGCEIYNKLISHLKQADKKHLVLEISKIVQNALGHAQEAFVFDGPNWAHKTNSNHSICRKDKKAGDPFNLLIYPTPVAGYAISGAVDKFFSDFNTKDSPLSHITKIIG